jgi:FkbM family methyltransferase
MEQLGIREPGYYVDVGCNDPIHHSNTWRLYQLGWSGIAIDGNKELIKKYRRVRPRDITIHALVSDRVEEVDFFVNHDDHTKSFLVPSSEAAIGSSKTALKVKMLTSTLNQILSDNKFPQTFDLLKVDVEGHDYQVIKSIDLGVYKPLIIIVESDEYGVANFMKTPMCGYLQSSGYYLHSLAGYNAIFLRSEK